MNRTEQTALFDFIPFHPNNDNEHTFTPIPRAIARIKKFNGVENDPGICLVYAHLLGWLNSTGDIRPSQQYIADDCVMSVDSVKRKIKALVKMGWITATPIRNPGSVKISHTVYTVKTPEEILKELPKTIKTKEEKPDEPEAESCACVADLPAISNVVPLPVHPAGDLPPDPSVECVDGLDDVPLILGKREPSASLETLEYWNNGGDDGFFEYGARYNLTKPSEIADLIKSHASIMRQRCDRKEPKQFRVSSDQQAALRERCRILEEQKQRAN